MVGVCVFVGVNVGVGGCSLLVWKRDVRHDAAGGELGCRRSPVTLVVAVDVDEWSPVVSETDSTAEKLALPDAVGRETVVEPIGVSPSPLPEASQAALAEELDRDPGRVRPRC